MQEPKVWISSRKLKSGKRAYYLRWIDPGTGHWRNQKVGTDRKRAEREAAIHEVKLRTGEYQELHRVRWPDFVSEHLASLPDGANRTEAARTLRALGDICQPLGPHAVTYSMIERFSAECKNRGNAPATVNKHMRYVRAALNKAKKRGYLARNPMDQWQFERLERKIPRALDEHEKARLLDACPTHQWRTLVFVALTTGCRHGELAAISWEWVDWEQATLRLPASVTKARTERIQPLHPQAVDMLRKLQATTIRDGGPFKSLGNIQNRAKHFRRIVEAAGIARCTVHDLRRTFCSDLAAAGVNQVVVQRLAGHASMTTTAQYYQAVGDQTKRAAIRKLA